MTADTIGTIKRNLEDRYASGFPILKELLQNADDAPGTTRFVLDALPGWPDAANPLLQGPGLLVVNDGRFRDADAKAMRYLGASAKAGEAQAAGKFGFGQKAVFHLCDAFVVHARGGNPHRDVLNPYVDAEAEGNISWQWEALTDGDLDRLNGAVPGDFPAQRLMIWVPFRRDRILPTPGGGFTTVQPDVRRTLDELVQPEELRPLLAGLRRLTSIEIREAGKILLAIRTSGGCVRMLGPETYSGVKGFGGEILTQDGPTTRFVGREAMVSDQTLSALRLDPHWPRNQRSVDAAATPEKGEPHGAATLTEIGPARSSERGELRVSWAVFLPVSEAADITIPLGEGDGRFRLMLHGYFFVDSGRRQIEALDNAPSDAPPADAAGLRAAWNVGLRDTAVLPRLPGLLRDALDAEMMTASALARLVSAISSEPWFSTRRSAIGAEQSLAQVIEGRAVVWRLIEPHVGLRPLPATATPQRLEQLFEGATAWAAARNLRLAVDRAAILSANTLRWSTEELEELLARLSPRAFQSQELATFLAEFLGLAVQDTQAKNVVGAHLVQTLRRAMIEPTSLAPPDAIRAILEFVPRALLRPLPASVVHRKILRALASAGSSVLPVGGRWISEPVSRTPIRPSDLEALLRALEPLIEGEPSERTSEGASDQAALAALSLLSQADEQLATLARNVVFAGIKTLRARRAGDLERSTLSIADLEEEARLGRLFSASPDLNTWAPALARALPENRPFIVEGETAKLLGEAGALRLRLRPAPHERLKAAVLSLVTREQRFGPDDARRDLLLHLRPAREDDRAALRQLCAGSNAVRGNGIVLLSPGDAFAGLDRIVAGVLQDHPDTRLVPSIIADVLAPDIARHIGIGMLGAAQLEGFLGASIEAFNRLGPVPAECEALLATELSDGLLKRLPIHATPEGVRVNATDAFRVEDWPVPVSMKSYVTIIRAYAGQKALQRQQRIIPAWSPRAQIEIALSQPKPSEFQAEILSALAKMEGRPDDTLCATLRDGVWLTAGARVIAPKDVLKLPLEVSAAASVLRGDNELPFLPVAELDIGVREHPSFEHLEAWVLPDERMSFDLLALLVEDRRVVGRLGAPEAWPLNDYVTLAGAAIDLALPGWPLLSACLSYLGGQSAQASTIAEAFLAVAPAQAGLAAAHLSALADAVQYGGVKGEAARRAYRVGFGVVAGWEDRTRREVFASTDVPTQSGAWRRGNTVAREGEGLDPSCVLERDLAARFPKDEPAQPARSRGPIPEGRTGPARRV